MSRPGKTISRPADQVVEGVGAEAELQVAGGGSGNINFILRKSATQSGGAINGTIVQILATPVVAQNDARLATAGAFVIRVGLPYEADLRYLDVLAVLSGSATITYEARIAEAPSDKHTQVIESNVGNP